MTSNHDEKLLRNSFEEAYTKKSCISPDIRYPAFHKGRISAGWLSGNYVIQSITSNYDQRLFMNYFKETIVKKILYLAGYPVSGFSQGPDIRGWLSGIYVIQSITSYYDQRLFINYFEEAFTKKILYLAGYPVSGFSQGPDIRGWLSGIYVIQSITSYYDQRLFMNYFKETIMKKILNLAGYPVSGFSQGPVIRYPISGQFESQSIPSNYGERLQEIRLY